MAKLLRIDEHSRPDHYYLTAEDECYHILEYTPRQCHNYSPTNQLILNLKKPVDRKGKPEYHYKEKAINEAADMFRSVLKKDWLATTPTLVPIPCSKSKGHPLYDDRMLRVIGRMMLGLGGDVRELIVQTESMESFHGGTRMPPAELAQFYAVDESLCEGNVPTVIVLFDDMLTTGSHFKAAQSVLYGRWPNVPVAGIFLARVVRIPDDDTGLLAAV